MEERSLQKQKIIYLFIILAVLVNFSGLFVILMNIDATRYATIAKTMVLKNDYVNLYCDGTDWLDKPHFPFWITAFSFKIFGFTTWAYKLPGILFLMMGAWYMYLFAKKLYNKQIALLAVLILLTAQHIILSNNDVRAEPYLTGLIIAGVYHFYEALKKRSFWNLLIASVFAACAVMSKGIFALIPIGAAIGGELIIKKDWKNLFHVRWVLAAILIFLFITPELYCLYYQFDLHPEKIVFGRTNVSGIKFFFWDSQFGRFVNTGPIKGKGDPFFFLHTTLWAFLPWSLLLFAAVFATIRNYLRKPSLQEWYCISGAFVTFIIFSLSRFQLPYYLNIIFPFFAIITAQYMYRLKSGNTIVAVKYVQLFVIFLLFVVVALIQLFYKPEHLPFVLLCFLLLLIALIFLVSFVKEIGIKQKIIYKTDLTCFFVNLYLNLAFYPSLLHYQSGSEAAFWINQNNKNKLPVVVLQPNYALEFYLDQPVNYFDTSKTFRLQPFLLYTTKEQLTMPEQKAMHLTIVKEFVDYPVTRMKLQFINRNTRYKTLKKADVSIAN